MTRRELPDVNLVIIVTLLTPLMTTMQQEAEKCTEDRCLLPIMQRRFAQCSVELMMRLESKLKDDLGGCIGGLFKSSEEWK